MTAGDLVTATSQFKHGCLNFTLRSCPTLRVNLVESVIKVLERAGLFVDPVIIILNDDNTITIRVTKPSHIIRRTHREFAPWSHRVSRDVSAAVTVARRTGRRTTTLSSKAIIGDFTKQRKVVPATA